MKSTKILILLLALSGLASCMTVDGCAGWRPVHLKATTAEYMAVNDPKPLAVIIGNHEFGQSGKCWK